MLHCVSHLKQKSQSSYFLQAQVEPVFSIEVPYTPHPLNILIVGQNALNLEAEIPSFKPALRADVQEHVEEAAKHHGSDEGLHAGLGAREGAGFEGIVEAAQLLFGRPGP